MKKREDQNLSKDEQEIAKEVLDEVKEEIKEETPQKIRKKARNNAYSSIILGTIGLLIPPPFSILVGFGALIFARDAITNGQRKLGLVGAILGFLAVIVFLINAGMGVIYNLI
jgi:hypothetical protein